MFLLLTMIATSFAADSFTCVSQLYPAATADASPARLVHLARIAMSPTLLLAEQNGVLLTQNKLSKDEWRKLSEAAFNRIAPATDLQTAIFDHLFAQAQDLELPFDEKPRFGLLRKRRVRVGEAQKDLPEVVRGIFDDRPDYDFMQFPLFADVRSVRPYMETFRRAMIEIFRGFETRRDVFPQTWADWLHSMDEFLGEQFPGAPPVGRRFVIHALESFYLKVPRINEEVLVRGLRSRMAKPVALVREAKEAIVPSARIRETEAARSAHATEAAPDVTRFYPDATELEITDVKADQIYQLPLRDGMSVNGSALPSVLFELSPTVRAKLESEPTDPFETWRLALRNGSTPGTKRRGILLLVTVHSRMLVLWEPVAGQYIRLERRDIEHPKLGRVPVFRLIGLEKKLSR